MSKYTKIPVHNTRTLVIWGTGI